MPEIENQMSVVKFSWIVWGGGWSRFDPKWFLIVSSNIFRKFDSSTVTFFGPTVFWFGFVFLCF